MTATKAKMARRVKQISRKLHKAWKRGERRYPVLAGALYLSTIDHYSARGQYEQELDKPGHVPGEYLP